MIIFVDSLLQCNGSKGRRIADEAQSLRTRPMAFAIRRTTNRRDFLCKAGLDSVDSALAASWPKSRRGSRNRFASPALPPASLRFQGEELHLSVHGGGRFIDLFDPKPELTKRHGTPLPASFGPCSHRWESGQHAAKQTQVRPARPVRHVARLVSPRRERSTTSR